MKQPALPATGSSPRPGDFPLGSPASRAAARMWLAGLVDNRAWITLYSESENGSWHFGEWGERPDGGMLRIVSTPIVWATLPVETIPICELCGEPFKQQGRYKDVVYFSPVCVERHDPNAPPANRRRSNQCLPKEEWQRSADWYAMIHAWDQESKAGESSQDSFDDLPNLEHFGLSRS
jgi:hypothetical protein